MSSEQSSLSPTTVPEKPTWIFSDEAMSKLPSFADGLTPEEELHHRTETIQFIQVLARKLQCVQITIATSIIFLHRFYMLHSFKHYNRFLIGMTCLFVAGKCEENQVKLSDVIIQGRTIANAAPFHQKFAIPAKDTSDFQDIRLEMLKYERILLQTLHFELTVHHPYKNLVDSMKVLNQSKEFLQIAWNFVNDSLRTTVTLQYTPVEIASAAILLASVYMDVTLEEGWLETKMRLPGQNAELRVNEVCRRICALYAKSNNQKIKEKFASFMA